MNLGPDGRVRPCRFVDSPNQDERPAGEAPTLLIVHAISLPPGEYGGEAIERLSGQSGGPPARLTAEAVEELARHDFPGNIRELENILERALALSGSREIDVEDLRLSAPTGTPVTAAAPADTASSALPDYLDDIERKAIIEALGKTGFNRTTAAKLLGITFRQLRYRMQRLGIKDDTKA